MRRRLGGEDDGVQEKLPRGVVKEIMLERILLVTNFSGIERDVVSCLYESDVILFLIPFRLSTYGPSVDGRPEEETQGAKPV